MIGFSLNIVVCNRYPFGLLVKFRLWNLTSFKISIVFQRLSGKLPMFVFVFAKKLKRSWILVLVPGPSGNTKFAYFFAVIAAQCYNITTLSQKLNQRLRFLPASFTLPEISGNTQSGFFSAGSKGQAPVVWKLNSAIYRIIHYPRDKY